MCRCELDRRIACICKYYIDKQNECCRPLLMGRERGCNGRILYR